MPVALQTMSWGRRPDVAKMLRDIKKVGYDGIELGQIPSAVGSADDFGRLLNEAGLILVGIASGSLQEKVQFVDRYVAFQQADRLRNPRPVRESALTPYVYIDDGEPNHWAGVMENYRLALHPHMFRPYQNRMDFETVLAKNKSLMFLPDTAHLTVAGENVAKIISDFYPRIEAIHMKDWTAEWGRAYLYYSRGFTELGTGDVALDEVLKVLKVRGYRRWIVIEQDQSNDPLQSAVQSRNWLKRNWA